ncbi:CBASS cGAMP synthase [Pseudoalteromonas tunicata]|uniref:CBASS cGAMP synthase n=1 Tax=Pseudoalteromonas tunicata TaxID=314281 RepID=UPI00273F582D|nr:CBASS cGAMP synthase [Pseudoalteromonas tunicata]MDP5213071.1 CBASS cGAMP synthase [Pseudoalteromonas tunicata]
MKWSLHTYYMGRDGSLLKKLELTDNEKNKLKRLRAHVRKRIREVFDEAIEVAINFRKSESEEDVKGRLKSTRICHLSPAEQQTVARLIYEMEEDVRDGFIKLKPRFGTQGSFQYNTLNKPFRPCQEMDIDDGTYLPMTVFENPKIGHKLLTLLVDTSLKSLVAENPGWEFESKRTCARIKIAEENTHIDVPMYAIPDKGFITKDRSLGLESANNIYESLGHVKKAAGSDDVMFERLDSKTVNLALRDEGPGTHKWMNSDPKVVEDWFNDACKKVGSHVRPVCRFMKAWRDAQWDVGGPSSISLMAATVEILSKHSVNPKDMGDIMKVVARNFAFEFKSGVESPDDTDDRPLFPAQIEHEDFHKGIVAKLEQLPVSLLNAENAPTKQDALLILSSIFGNRVTDANLIKIIAAAPAFNAEPAQSSSPAKISTSMVSG